MTTTSLLQTALQNLHVSQQMREQVGSNTPKAPSSVGDPGSPGSGLVTPPLSESSADEDEDDENVMVKVGKGTAPGTPVPGQKGMVLGQRLSGLGGGRAREKDPLRTLPTHLAVRVFLQLDVKSLARCDRVCKRWRKSSTLNYVWFLQNRALLLPRISDLAGANGKVRKTGDDTPDFFDPYDKSPRISSLPLPPIPSNTAPQWSKAESKKAWKSTFRTTLKRSDPNAEPEIDPLRVDIDSLASSGTHTPSGRHSYAGLGSGGAAKWATDADGVMTPSERKIAARENYKALGGRKSRMKRKMGGEMGARDKGGVVDDGRFDAPF